MISDVLFSKVKKLWRLRGQGQQCLASLDITEKPQQHIAIQSFSPYSLQVSVVSLHSHSSPVTGLLGTRSGSSQCI